MSAASRQSQSEEPCPRCPCGVERMKLVRTFPRFAAMPELWTFRCERRGHVETIEIG